jgi:putative SOS response-associated peptidase YedK
MTAANIVRPHVVTAECLRLRFGTWADIRVSREKIETAAVSHRAAPGKTISVVTTNEGATRSTVAARWGTPPPGPRTRPSRSASSWRWVWPG